MIPVTIAEFAKSIGLNREGVNGGRQGVIFPKNVPGPWEFAMESAFQDISTLLELLQADPKNADHRSRLFGLVEQRLKRMATRYLSQERANPLLQPTVLVDDAFLQLVNSPVPWQNRQHFFSAATRNIRHALVNFARERLRDKRGGSAKQHRLSEIDEPTTSDGAGPDEIVALDELLQQLEATDPSAASVFSHHYLS